MPCIFHLHINVIKLIISGRGRTQRPLGARVAANGGESWRWLFVMRLGREGEPLVHLAVTESPYKAVNVCAQVVDADAAIYLVAPADKLTGWLGHVLVAGEYLAALHGLEEPHHACIRTVM